MITQKYKIEGMTCGGCVAKVKSSLEKIKEVEEVKIRLAYPQGEVKFSRLIDESSLQKAIGEYLITPIEPINTLIEETDDPPLSSLQTYQPLLLIVIFIIGITLLIQYPFDNFSGVIWMRHFMAGFFLVFAFFKFLNLRSFANSYQMYDIIAGQWKWWGYVYPFVELLLGIFYLINIVPVFTSTLTIVILGISSIGVIQSVLDKRKIKCACLGDVFNLPMSTVTIIEDLSMVAMAVAMLFFM